MNAFEFIIILVLLSVSVTAAFFVGFGVGISDKTVIRSMEHKRNFMKKHKSQNLNETSERIKELNRVLADMESYDGSVIGGR